MAEHLLHAPQVGAALEQMRRERVAEQVGVDAPGLEAGLLGEPLQDQERARAGQRAALGVQEQLGPVAAVEVGPAAGQVAPQRLDRLAPDRDDPLLAALAEHADHALVEVDAVLLEARRLGDAQAGAVEELDERGVRGARAASSRPRHRSAARPRRPRACAAAGGCVAAAAISAAGLSPRTPISCRWPKKLRAAAVRRASVADESPSARISAV